MTSAGEVGSRWGGFLGLESRIYMVTNQTSDTSYLHLTGTLPFILLFTPPHIHVGPSQENNDVHRS